ncbi:MAG TPA: arginine--tRNA ligase [Candidatus Aenigmarchaeota archaeon]|nr:arginine--tRNA ligase [Candidatus Aenigmarchaeota archaeon]
MFIELKKHVAEILASALDIEAEEIEDMLEVPSNVTFGDLALPCFKLSKKLNASANKIARDITNRVAVRVKGDRYIEHIACIGAYVNFKFNWKRVGKKIIKRILDEGARYGSSKEGAGKTIVIDYSAPNIAKPMSVGHLRSTIIGDALKRIYSFLGYTCIGDLHQGDWGTQFGKLICAYKLWGDEDRLKKDAIRHLLELYVRFHKEAENRPELEDEARAWFKRLEEGDKDAIKLWKLFSNLSLKEFDRIYRLLGVSFELKLGESFYNTHAKRIVKRLLDLGIAKYSENAVIIDLERYSLPPLVIQKSDETTLYSTRDLATIEYREREFKPSKILYVVGLEQKLYFQQVFKVAELMGFNAKKYVHVDFGLITLPEGKLSTRKGRVIFLEDVINKGIELALKIIREKGIVKENEKEVAKKVAIGAIKYADLSQNRIKNITFSWSKMLNFEGNSGPYLQYTYARARSILRKGSMPTNFNTDLLQDKREIEIIKTLSLFPLIVKKAAKEYEPHHIANYVYKLAEAFNEFYQSVPVLRAESSVRDARLALVKATAIVIRNGLNLLGIEAIEQM